MGNINAAMTLPPDLNQRRRISVNGASASQPDGPSALTVSRLLLRPPSGKELDFIIPCQTPSSLSQVGTFSTFHRHRRFCSEGEPAKYVYKLLEGVAEGYHITSDGRRQIIGFYAPGDFFGVEAGAEYTIFVDGITCGRVQSIKRTAVAQLMASNSPALEELWSGIAADIYRSQKHILRLGRPATERIASFLLEMCDRLSDCDKCHLPMTRQEIGDHLGLTIETVSRTLTHLRQSGLIALLGSRDIVVIDRQRLRRLTC
jgi:CRP/FNR family transcriptional regulator, nitrogen fixation regulation protein